LLVRLSLPQEYIQIRLTLTARSPLEATLLSNEEKQRRSK
jgi:hypothetical protein